ncbi:hypothetical protein Hanom_Chr14g01299041 [Helianthus anomalus]
MCSTINSSRVLCAIFRLCSEHVLSLGSYPFNLLLESWVSNFVAIFNTKQI